jgi:hypothetical protein
MSIVKTWGYDTNAASDTPVTPSSINPVSSFALIQDEPDECRLRHQQAVDNAEMLTYMCKDIGNVGTYLKSVHPTPVKAGVQYSVRLDEQLKLTSSDEPTYAETVPVVATLTIRHPKNGNITTGDIETVFKRLIGACYKEVSGTVSSRFGDLMQSALRPVNDGIDPAS